MPTMSDVMAKVNKECGENTMILPERLKRDPWRIPFGIFVVDYITGGGIPINETACLWGPESASKTYMALNSMKSVGNICWRCKNYIERCTCSLPTMKMKTYVADVEGTMDGLWAEQIGVPKDSYIIGHSDYGEQAVDLCDYALRADDCGLVILDSLANLIPRRELEGESEDTNMGQQPILITRAVRRLKQRLITEAKRGHECSVVYINQMRSNLTIKFGSNEDMPGGHGMKHEFSLLLRCMKKALQEPEKKKYIDHERGDKKMASRHSISIKKEKVFTIAGVGEFLLIKENIPEAGLRAGQVHDMNIVLTMAKDTGILTKDGATWKVNDLEFRTQQEIKEACYNDYLFYMTLQRAIIHRAKQRIKENHAD